MNKTNGYTPISFTGNGRQIEPRSERMWFGVILIIALAVRMIIFNLVAAHPLKYYSNSDAYGYEQIALNLLHFGVFSVKSRPPLISDIYRTPIYPTFLAGVYAVTNQSPSAAIILQILIGGLAAALTYLMSFYLDLPKACGLIAGLIVAFDPLTVLTTYQLLTEILFSAILLLGLIFLVAYWNTARLSMLVMASMSLAAAALTRPIGQFLPFALLPVFLIVYAKRRQHWRQSLFRIFLFLLITLSLIQSWAYRNYHEANIWTVSAIGEEALLYYSARDVVAATHDISKEEATQELEGYIQNQINTRNLTKAQSIALVRQKAMEIFRQYPKQTLIVHLKGLARVLINPGLDLICVMLNQQNDPSACAVEDSKDFLSQIAEKFSVMDNFQKVVAIWGIILLLVVYTGTTLGIWFLIRHHNWFVLILFLTLIAYFSLLSAGGESVSRFRIPFLPFLGIITGIGLVSTFGYLKRFRNFPINKSSVFRNIFEIYEGIIRKKSNL